MLSVAVVVIGVADGAVVVVVIDNWCTLILRCIDIVAVIVDASLPLLLLMLFHILCF